ncbi:unnamed protein product [Trifolium pratense]|uniref:Uncharacterized protein n=1 Tax=Trifolium pratense TaxID=57577 RepID=A0ACB0L917_TRIPR|nr:unnamed protein product [Trifolium pratense]
MAESPFHHPYYSTVPSPTPYYPSPISPFSHINTTTPSQSTPYPYPSYTTFNPYAHGYSSNYNSYLSPPIITHNTTNTLQQQANTIQQPFYHHQSPNISTPIYHHVDLPSHQNQNPTPTIPPSRLETKLSNFDGSEDAYCWFPTHRRPCWDSFTCGLLRQFKPEWIPILPIDGEEDSTNKDIEFLTLVEEKEEPKVIEDTTTIKGEDEESDATIQETSLKEEETTGFITPQENQNSIRTIVREQKFFNGSTVCLNPPSLELDNKRNASVEFFIGCNITCPPPMEPLKFVFALYPAPPLPPEPPDMLIVESRLPVLPPSSKLLSLPPPMSAFTSSPWKPPNPSPNPLITQYLLPAPPITLPPSPLNPSPSPKLQPPLKPLEKVFFPFSPFSPFPALSQPPPEPPDLFYLYLRHHVHLENHQRRSSLCSRCHHRSYFHRQNHRTYNQQH